METQGAVCYVCDAIWAVVRGVRDDAQQLICRGGGEELVDCHRICYCARLVCVLCVLPPFLPLCSVL